MTKELKVTETEIPGLLIIHAWHFTRHRFTIDIAIRSHA